MRGNSMRMIWLIPIIIEIFIVLVVTRTIIIRWIVTGPIGISISKVTTLSYILISLIPSLCSLPNSSNWLSDGGTEGSRRGVEALGGIVLPKAMPGTLPAFLEFLVDLPVIVLVVIIKNE